MVKLISNLLCLVYIKNLRIVVGENLLTEEQFEALSATKEYEILKKNGKFEVLDVADEAAEAAEEKTISEMTVAELKVYAKAKGLEGISGKSKGEILDLIKELDEE